MDEWSFAKALFECCSLLFRIGRSKESTHLCKKGMIIWGTVDIKSCTNIITYEYMIDNRRTLFTQLKQFWNESLKRIQASTEFKPMTSAILQNDFLCQDKTICEPSFQYPWWCKYCGFMTSPVSINQYMYLMVGFFSFLQALAIDPKNTKALYRMGKVTYSPPPFSLHLHGS